jgi:hypothetical protein
MLTRILIIIVAIHFSDNIFAEKPDSVMILQIDSIVGLNASKVSNDSIYKQIQLCGYVSKKVFKLFNKRIASFSASAITKDTLIYSIEYFYDYFKNDKYRLENFYYQNNKLIKYCDSSYLDSESGKHKLEHKVIAYFHKDSLVNKFVDSNDGYLFNGFNIRQTLDISIFEKDRFVYSTNYFKHESKNMSPIDNGLKIKTNN